MPRPVILDVDTGTDDAIAIMVAALSPDLDLIGISTCWGNLPVANTTDNTLRVLDDIGAGSIPVAKGLDRPIAPMPEHQLAIKRGGPAMHPERLNLPDSQLGTVSDDAITWLVNTIRNSPEPVTLVPVAPLSNIAAALIVAPDIVENVAEVVIMGGANEFGNCTPSAESNIWHDAPAADAVFRAGFQRVTLVPLDATHKALITGDQADEIAGIGTPGALAAADCLRQRVAAHDASQPQPIPHSAAVHDPLCIAYLIDPSVIETVHCNVTIETTGFYTYGRTVVDLRHRGRDAPNAHVAMDVDADLYYDLLKRTLANVSTETKG